MNRSRTRGRSAARGVAIAALLAGLATACGPAGTQGDTHGADDSPQLPGLFPDHTVHVAVSRELAAQGPRARHLMKAWWRSHGARPDDTAFVRFLERTAPPPPSGRERTREIHRLRALAAHRTTEGIAAATWLDDYGKDDIWKQYAHQLPTDSQGASGEIDDMLDVGSQVADVLKTRFHQPSPYVVDPALRQDRSSTSVDSGGCTCSYPSTHATDSAAAVTFLSHLDSGQSATYRHMQQEVAYSRLYMAGHTRSDLATGTLLGDMLGEYFLVTRGHVAAPHP